MTPTPNFPLLKAPGKHSAGIGVYAVFLLGWFSAASAQDIPLEWYELENGLDVVLIEDHRLPQVVVETLYEVGSYDDPEGASGFAHLFEHLMFMGTVDFPEGEFDRLIEAVGGSNNAYTADDFTDYYDWGPSEIVDLLLELEADRMTGLDINQERLDLQRDVVRNERRQNYEDEPYGDVWLALPEMLFPRTHPYHRPGVGSHDDLIAATLDHVVNFYRDWYAPNNALLAVAGDFDPDHVRARIEELYGPLEAAPVQEHADYPAVERPVEFCRTITDQVHLPYVLMVWHTPSFFEPFDAEMDVLATLLTGGADARLTQRLEYEERVAQYVSSFQISQRRGSIFVVAIMGMPGSDLGALEAAVHEELARLAGDDLATDDEMTAAINGWEMVFLRNLETVAERASRALLYLYYIGRPDFFEEDIERYRQVSADSIAEAVHSWLTPDRVSVLRIVPEGYEEPCDEQWRPIVPEVRTLESGAELVVVSDHTLPLISLRISIPRGAAEDPDGLWGRAALTAEMLSEAAGERSSIELAADLRRLAASVGSWANRDHTQFSLSVHAERLEQALPILGDIVLRPRFDLPDWERVKEQTINSLVQSLEDAPSVASLVMRLHYYQEGDSLGFPSGGLVETIEAISVEDAQAWYQEVLDTTGVTFSVAGDITADRAQELLELTFESWRPTTPPPERLRSEQAPDVAGRILVVDMPGATQTAILIQGPGYRMHEQNFAPPVLAGIVLGGTFNSRLNQLMREEKGYTYGVRAGFSESPRYTIFSVRSSVDGPSTAEALTDILSTLQGGADGYSPEELERAQAQFLSSTVSDFETMSSIAGLFVFRANQGLPYDSIDDELLLVEQVTMDEMAAATHEHVNVDQMLIVLVGDVALIEEQLIAAGFEFEVVSLPE